MLLASAALLIAPAAVFAQMDMTGAWAPRLSEDFLERSSALVGSPEQVIDKVGRYHDQLGHEAIHLSADADGVTAGQQRRSHELFQSDVAPVLRERIRSRPLNSQLVRLKVKS